MSSTLQFTRRELILFSLIFLFVLAAIAAAGYYFGYLKNIETVELMEREMHIRVGQYGDSLDVLYKENAEVSTREVVLCTEYQKLYQAYLDLRSHAPDASIES